jgi:hypothetical protein
VQSLIRRYLEGFGPASARDFAQFTMLWQTTVRPALEAIADTLTTIEGPDGEVLFDIPGAPVPSDDTPAPPRLLPMWDSILLAYADHSCVIAEYYRKLVIRRNGDVLPTMLVGYVCGVWRPVDDGIEALAFHPLPDDASERLAAEAGGLLALIRQRDPSFYGRYTHWWTDLSGAEFRVLAG